MISGNTPAKKGAGKEALPQVQTCRRG